MNKLGSGVTNYDEYKSDEMTIFSGGLRSDTKKVIHNIRDDWRNHHDKISYNRGVITHSRSPATQYFNFHWMYGGFRKYFFQRFLYQVMYKRIIRVTAIPFVICYSREFKSSSFIYANV